VRYDAVYEERMYRPAVREYFAQKGYYNYGYWEPDTRDQGAACRNLVGRLLDLLPDKRGRLLEVACGLGGTTSDLIEHFPPASVIAVDLSARNVHTARGNAPGCNGAIVDAAVLPFRSASVGNIVSVEAAFHFRTRQRFFEESYRVLEPGGGLVLSDILFRRVRSSFLPSENYLADLAAYEALLQGAGFRDARVLDVTEACWGGFRRNLRAWGWGTFRSTRGSVPAALRMRRILGLALWLGSLRLALRHYLLVAAVK
jgi:MPBQ/MSBQ methyltransferase